MTQSTEGKVDDGAGQSLRSIAFTINQMNQEKCEERMQDFLSLSTFQLVQFWTPHNDRDLQSRGRWFDWSLPAICTFDFDLSAVDAITTSCVNGVE